MEKMYDVSGITACFASSAIKEKKAAVKEGREALVDRQFDLREGAALPKSAQFARKLVIDCPVDVTVRTGNGDVYAELHLSQD